MFPAVIFIYLFFYQTLIANSSVFSKKRPFWKFCSLQNKIISGNTTPSLTKIFEICEFLDIPPKMLFDFDTPKETRLAHLQELAVRLDAEELDYFIRLMDGILLLKERKNRKDGG